MNRLIITSLLFSILYGCSNNTSKRMIENLDSLSLRKGDIVFREGIGVTSKIIKFLDPKGIYTHVGIVTDSAEHWMVIHAVPGEPDFKDDPDRVKMESIMDFYGFAKAESGAIVRHKDYSVACMAANNAYRLYKKGVLFDHNYDETDTTYMYCSELINYVFSISGDTLVKGKNDILQNNERKYIFPSDIYNSKSLIKITNF